VVISGLEPATEYPVRVGERPAGTVTTLAPPPGRLLCRFATVSDCHIGERRLGLFHRIRDPRPLPEGLDPYPVRSARAAIAEAEAWGAEVIVAKGDLTREAEEEEAERVAGVLASASVPVHAILGNHDVRGPADVRLALAGAGIAVTDQVQYRDLPGFRLILGHSPLPDRHAGRLSDARVAQVVELAREASTAAVVALHHPPSRWPVPTYYPPALHWADSRALAAGLAETKRGSLVLAGHTHRNRRYRIGGVDVAEVGSTKDYPGQWAGYAVHEGGIRQVVRRTLDPSVIPWTEMTRRALGGLWGWWSPGTLADRCWTISWP
jgi:3',5'-cyclic AMP phosphodiesterase CpdA